MHCFGDRNSSSLSNPNMSLSSNSAPYPGGSYHGGQGLGNLYSPYGANSPLASGRVAPAPRSCSANKVRLFVYQAIRNYIKWHGSWFLFFIR